MSFKCGCKNVKVKSEKWMSGIRAGIRAGKEAVTQGDLEARRHLGFAYSDDNFADKNLVHALGWYESIFLLYPTPSELEPSDQGVYNDAVEGADKLRGRLSEKQRNAAIAFAKSTL